MIVVVASIHDARALRIVAEWGSKSAAVLSAEDLCMPGWVFRVPIDPHTTAVIGGQKIPGERISGILTLRPCIFPEELQDTQAAHRTYVAAELNAFLLAWLTAQSSRVVNRPTACCLAGPNWRPEQWTQAAARLDIPARTWRHIPSHNCIPNDGETLEVITVGEQCFGCGDSGLREKSLKLAQAAGVELLSVRFSVDRTRFVSASAWPSLTDPAVLEAVRQRLETPR